MRGSYFAFKSINVSLVLCLCLQIDVSCQFHIFLDCCDGSDEYDGSINCPATCIMGGNFVYKSDHGYSKVNDLGIIYGETKSGMSLDDLIEKLRGMLLFMTG